MESITYLGVSRDLDVYAQDCQSLSPASDRLPDVLINEEPNYIELVAILDVTPPFLVGGVSLFMPFGRKALRHLPAKSIMRSYRYLTYPCFPMEVL